MKGTWLPDKPASEMGAPLGPDGMAPSQCSGSSNSSPNTESTSPEAHKAKLERMRALYSDPDPSEEKDAEYVKLRRELFGR
jgi:hypothetical protein